MRYLLESRRDHRARNLLHSAILICGMALLTGISAWILWGPLGLVWSLVAVAVAVIFIPRGSPQMVMKLFRARPLRADEAPVLMHILTELAARAGLDSVPRLYLLPSTTLNAFAVGRRDDAAIAVSSGLLNTLTPREITGVLAHEISHVRNNDLVTMGLADTFARLTQMMSYIAVFLFILNLPLALSGQAAVPWLAIMLLYFAPFLGNLLQMALSRTREYIADEDGAHLSGDPGGLASALEKLERYQGRFWEDMLPMGRRMPVPSVLRTHPPTEERIRRLLSLNPERPALALPSRQHLKPAPWGRADLLRKPAYHWPGIWY